MKNLNVSGFFICLLAFLFLLWSGTAHAALARNTGRFMSGFSKVTTAAFELPFQLVKQTVSQPFPLGVVSGVIQGTANTVGKVVGGTIDMGAAAAPYAKYAVFAL